jgi:transposase
MCERKTFAEQFPDIIAPYARRTNRLVAKQRQTGLELGGETGARVLTEMAMPISGDTVLRLVRNTPFQKVATPRVLGIDDWAWCKGQRYGTILVDLERHRPIDLLSDRSAESIAAWLRAHPGVEIISRDRASEYIKGINQGAPDATQVADRWHLLRNLKDALVRILEQNQACLYAAASEPEDDPEPMPTPEVSTKAETTDNSPHTKAEQRRQAARERRLIRYQAVMDLYEQGTKIRAIARQLGLSRRTVRRYIKAGRFPETAQRKKRRGILSPYLTHLEQRWAEGCHNGLQLYREIREQGYSGSRPTVSRWATEMRKRNPEPTTTHSVSTEPRRRPRRPWSAHYAVWLFLKPSETLSLRKKAALERMLVTSPVLRCVYNFAQAFTRIVRNRLSKALKPWLNAVIENKIPGLNHMARSIKKDENAVLAALTLPWSNGQVEGQVNRLKLIKRQMYGRAKFDLLRLRVLSYSGP